MRIYLLSQIAQSGTNGQFRTPRHIIKMMVELMQPTLEDTICEKTLTALIQTYDTTKKTQKTQKTQLPLAA